MHTHHAQGTTRCSTVAVMGRDTRPANQSSSCLQGAHLSTFREWGTPLILWTHELRSGYSSATKLRLKTSTYRQDNAVLTEQVLSTCATSRDQTFGVDHPKARASGMLLLQVYDAQNGGREDEAKELRADPHVSATIWRLERLGMSRSGSGDIIFQACGPRHHCSF